MQKPETRREKRKDLIEDERQFLSSLMHHGDYVGPWQEAGLLSIRQAVGRYAGAAWRRFLDKRHRALLRAFETLDLAKEISEREEAIKAESGRPADYYIDNLKARKELEAQATGIAWLERELAAAGALAACGGKAYLRGVYGLLPFDLPEEEMRRLEKKLAPQAAAKKGGVKTE